MTWDRCDIGKKVSLFFHFFSECTQAGILKLSCSRTLPFWWDDVSDLNTLEALAVQAYNQVITCITMYSFYITSNFHFYLKVPGIASNILRNKSALNMGITFYIP